MCFTCDCEQGRFCHDIGAGYAIAFMHVTSWSESYPLRNSLMGVRGFRQVVSSFNFVLKRPALLALERQSQWLQGMRSFSPPKTTFLGRLFEGET